jgi:CTP:molybdopterin cytidylyltransferase MocA
MSASTVAVIVVAAGSGTRLGHTEPKAFVPLGDDTILGVALDAVLGMHETPHVVLVVPATASTRRGPGSRPRQPRHPLRSTSSRAATPGSSPSPRASRCCRTSSTRCSCTTRPVR